jgi:hypothetical protein
MGVVSVYGLCDETIDATGIGMEIIETGIELYHSEQHQANGEPDGKPEDIDKAIGFLKKKNPPNRFAKQVYHIRYQLNE